MRVRLRTRANRRRVGGGRWQTSGVRSRACTRAPDVRRPSPGRKDSPIASARASMSVPIDRREFLTRTALGAAALTLSCVRRQPASVAGARSGMFVSLPPWALARNVGWPEQARLAARVGYKGIDWAFGPAKAAGVEATRALLTELAIEPTIVNLPMRDTLGPDDAAFEAQLPTLAEDAAFCRAIGCSRFQLVLSPVTLEGQPKAERWTLVQRRLSAVGAVLAKHDVRLGLEFLGPLVFRTRRSRPGGAPVDPAAPPPPMPVP